MRGKRFLSSLNPKTMRKLIAIIGISALTLTNVFAGSVTSVMVGLASPSVGILIVVLAIGIGIEIQENKNKK